MADWNRVLGRLAREIETRADALGDRLSDVLPGSRERVAHIAAYRGYGRRSQLFVSGRVLADRRLRSANRDDPWWRNLASTLRRMESDELAGARVRIRIGGTEHTAVTDEEGYFRAWLDVDPPLPSDRLWHTADVKLLATPEDGSAASGPTVAADAPVLTPAESAVYGVISDLDDTVVRTDVTSLVRMLRATLLHNAHTRLPFEGVAAFYRALHDGAGGGDANPIFYVSSSPWNLYDLIAEFLELRDIPMGPIMLRDWGINADGGLPTSHRAHKLAHIRQILGYYPDLPFILIGDSGQKDPEIYRDIVAEHPSRVRAIYIRNVSRDELRCSAIRKLAAEVRDAGSTLVFADDTYEAARHAAEHGWIDETRLAEVEREKKEDEPLVRTHTPTVVIEKDRTIIDE
ncbi:MAG: App1 family protein [Longimicrobiales bacterium]